MAKKKLKDYIETMRNMGPPKVKASGKVAKYVKESRDNLGEVLDEFIEHEQLWHFEMERGVRNLETILKGIGYRDGLSDFLPDNPGAIEAIVEWIKEQNNDEWKEELESRLPPPMDLPGLHDDMDGDKDEDADK